MKANCINNITVLKKGMFRGRTRKPFLVSIRQITAVLELFACFRKAAFELVNLKPI